MTQKDELAGVIADELNKTFKHQKVAYFLDDGANPTDVVDYISTGSTILDLAISNKPNGGDIMIERQTPAEAGNHYGKTTVRVKPNQTPITENKTLLEAVFENQPNLTELYTEPSYDELKEALAGYLNPENETDTTTTSNGVTATTAPTTNVGQPKAAKTENVEDAFDQLFNQ